MSAPVARITLASSTKISLHERFTKLAKLAPVLNDKIPRVNNTPLKSTERNRRLALQMANRPSVQAALRFKNKNLNQRLDGNIPRQGNQVQTPFKRRGLVNNQTNRLQNVKQRLGNRIGDVNTPRIGGRIKIIGTQQTRVVNKTNLGNRLRNPNQTGRFQRNNQNANNNTAINRVNNNNNGFKKRIGFQKVNNLKGRLQNNGTRKNFSKKQNVNGKQIKSNKISTVVAPAVVKDKDALDMDLDTYMAKSKNHLDADLDTYMAQTTSILI